MKIVVRAPERGNVFMREFAEILKSNLEGLVQHAELATIGVPDSSAEGSPPSSIR